MQVCIFVHLFLSLSLSSFSLSLCLSLSLSSFPNLVCQPHNRFSLYRCIYLARCVDLYIHISKYETHNKKAPQSHPLEQDPWKSAERSPLGLTAEALAAAAAAWWSLGRHKACIDVYMRYTYIPFIHKRYVYLYKYLYTCVYCRIYICMYVYIYILYTHIWSSEVRFKGVQVPFGLIQGRLRVDMTIGL